MLDRPAEILARRFRFFTAPGIWGRKDHSARSGVLSQMELGARNFPRRQLFGVPAGYRAQTAANYAVLVLVSTYAKDDPLKISVIASKFGAKIRTCPC